MAYRMNRNAGTWLQGQVVEDDVLEAHPFAQKFIKGGAAVKVGKDEKSRSANDQNRLNDLERQIADLNAQRDALLNPVAEAAAEVVQPTSGGAVVAEVAPAEKSKK